MILTAIAAYTHQRTLGAGNGMLWHLPEDFGYFKKHTMGHTLLMGRKTYEAIGKALPGRRTIVVTRSTDWTAPDVEIAHSKEEALAMTGAADDEVVFNAGGGEIYDLFLPETDRMLITEVDLDLEGDAYFPEWDRADWVEVSRTHRPAAEGRPAFDWVVYDRAR